MLKKTSRNLILIVLIGIYLFLLFYKLEDVPAFWFDEGWISSVARNWAEIGHYGQLLNGQPIPANMLNIGFPVVIPIAWSYEIFGIGIWQSRLVIALYSIGAFAALIFIVNRVYGRNIAVATTFFTVFPIIPSINSIDYSRQVVGEIPTAFFFLAGLVSILLFLRRPLIGLPILIAFWSFGMLTKSQLIPTLGLSYLMTTIIFIKKQKWMSARFLSIGFLSALLLDFLIIRGFPVLGNDLPPETRADLFRTIIFVLAPLARISALISLVFLGGPTIYGLISFAYDYLKGNWKDPGYEEHELVQIILMTFIGSWLLWFGLFSIGWPRYLVLPSLIGTVFFAYRIVYLVNHTNVQTTHEQEISSGIRLQFSKVNFRVIISITLILYALGANTVGWINFFLSENNQTIKDVVEYVNSISSQDSLIETYEMELFLFLNQKYHYPSNEMALLGIRKRVGIDLNKTYDPLDSNPDYLILGEMGKRYGFYDQAISSKEYRLINEIGIYDIYQKVE